MAQMFHTALSMHSASMPGASCAFFAAGLASAVFCGVVLNGVVFVLPIIIVVAIIIMAAVIICDMGIAAHCKGLMRR